MGWAVIFLAVLTYCTGSDGQSSWTQPASSSVSLGGSLSLSCTTTHSSYYISWYQQKEGKGPRFVHCDGCSDRGEGIPNRFTATRSGSSGSLAITNVEAEDDAIYYCGNWNSAGNQYVFGGGTRLTVTGQPTVSPSVQLFAPSPEEIRSPNPHTVVCVLTGFYPSSFVLQWKCDDKVMTSDVDTTPATKQGDNYIASSYMKLSASAYENCGTFTCTVRHEGKTIEKSVSKSGSC